MLELTLSVNNEASGLVKPIRSSTRDLMSMFSIMVTRTCYGGAVKCGYEGKSEREPGLVMDLEVSRLNRESDRQKRWAESCVEAKSLHECECWE